MKSKSAIEEVLLSLPDNRPETIAMKENLRAAKTPEDRASVIKQFLDEHGDENFGKFLGK